MKKKILQLLVLIPLLIFSAGLAAAYTAPSAVAPQGNTDAPLDVSATDQIKNGDLGVTTFEARGNAYLAKDVFFNGMIRGGTPGDKDSVVAFGDTGHKVGATVNGTATIIGHYQSDTLKTASGNKEPLCADQNGTFYICGTTPSSNPQPSAVYVHIEYQTPGSRNIVARVSEPISSQITVEVQASSGTAPNISFLRNYLTAEAAYEGSCSLTNSPTYLGGLTIPIDQTVSNNVLTLPNGCEPASTYLVISNYSPQSTMGGRPIREL